jgi:hypothetical protein
VEFAVSTYPLISPTTAATAHIPLGSRQHRRLVIRVRVGRYRPVHGRLSKGVGRDEGAGRPVHRACALVEPCRVEVRGFCVTPCCMVTPLCQKASQ